MLFEIATIGPGFTADEPLETLGESLSLPPNFEQYRDQVERILDAAPEPARGTLRVIVRERPAAGEADGALVLFHGRGADEHDLFPLLDVLDPERRLDGYCPRGPLSLPPGGAHWYVVPRVGYPDPPTFSRVVCGGCRVARLAAARAGRARRVLAGVRDGARAGARRGPAAAGRDLRLLGVHPGGRRAGSWTSSGRCRRSRWATATFDPVIPVEFGRAARDQLLAAGGELLYEEYPLPHTLDPAFLADVQRWLGPKV